MKNGKIFTGNIVNVLDSKTVKVLIVRLLRHKLYGKIVKSKVTVLCHNNDFDLSVGDMISIVKSRKFSKMKSWLVVGKI